MGDRVITCYKVAAPVGAVVVVMGVLVASAPAPAALPAGYGGTISVPAPHPMKAPDPRTAESPFEAWVEGAIFDRLYVLDDKGVPIPYLAESLPEIANRRARITIRSDLGRQDGRPLLASAVADSLIRALDAPRSRVWLPFVAAGPRGPDIMAVDERTVELGVITDEIDLARALASRALAVHGGRGRAGTGPFRGTEKDGGLALEAFRHSPSAGPFLGRINIEPPRSRDEELRAFELGQLDLSFHGASLYGRASLGAPPVSAPPVAPVVLIRRTSGGPLADPKAFAALARSIDRRRLERVGLEPTDRLAPGIRAPRLGPASRPPSRVTIRMPVVKGNTFDERVAEALAGILDEAGYALVIDRMDAASYERQLGRGEWDLRLATLVPDLPLPVAPVVAGLVEAGEDGLARRLTLSSDLTTVPDLDDAAERAPLIVLGLRRETLFRRPRLLGLHFDRTGNLLLGDLHLARGRKGALPQ